MAVQTVNFFPQIRLGGKQYCLSMQTVAVQPTGATGNQRNLRRKARADLLRLTRGIGFDGRCELLYSVDMAGQDRKESCPFPLAHGGQG